MKNLTFLSVIVGGILFSACSDGGKELITSLDNCPLVATFEQVGPNKVMVAHLEQMGDTLDMSLSSLVEDLYVIPLDNRDEALTKGENPHVTENYILIRPWSGEAAKLFDKEGRFICKIGDFGQGPGEYQNLYDEQIDEENNRIYLLPWQAKSVLAYDLNGNFVQNIPLAEEAPKGAVYVDTKTQRLIVGILPFQTARRPETDVDRPQPAAYADVDGRRRVLYALCRDASQAALAAALPQVGDGGRDVRDFLHIYRAALEREPSSGGHGRRYGPVRHAQYHWGHVAFLAHGSRNHCIGTARLVTPLSRAA